MLLLNFIILLYIYSLLIKILIKIFLVVNKRLFCNSNVNLLSIFKRNILTYVIGISGWSGSGKTRLITKLIKYFVNDHNLRVCTLKHAHSSFRLDKKGKDSYKFMTSGASRVIISSSKQWAVVNNIKNIEPSLEELLKLSKKDIDLVLVEGWKFSKIKKIEVYRKKINKPLLCNENKNFVAIATTSRSLKIKKKIPILNLNDTEEVGNFILNYLKN